MFKFIHCWLTLLKSVSWIASPLSVDYPLNHFSGFFYISLTHSSWVTEEFLTFLSLPLGVYWGTAKQFNLSPREEITKNWSQFRAVILDLFYMIFLRIKWKPWNVSHTNKSHSSACAHLQLHAKFLRFSKSLNRIRRPVLESLRGNYRSCWGGAEPRTEGSSDVCDYSGFLLGAWDPILCGKMGTFCNITREYLCSFLVWRAWWNNTW